MKLYGLYSLKKDCLMGVSVSATGSDNFCGDTEVSLDRYFDGDMLWTTTNMDRALEIVERGPTEWYNADMATPGWDLKRYGPLNVVDLNDFEIK